MLARITGITTPQNATNFLNPELCKNALLQTPKTKIFTAIWQNPAITDEPLNTFVKFAIMKKLSPVIPEIVIHRELLFRKGSPYLNFYYYITYFI
jgi:hypothetical protein